ncbi:hypothetical protein WEH80_03560 [Actinomycetes bacterium KLBMP 9759]
MTHAVLLTAHILSGTAGLLLGPFAMRQDGLRFVRGERTTGPLTTIYLGVVIVVCVSATGLVIDSRPDLWWLVPVAALTVGLVVLAVESARRRFGGWTHGYAHGMGGSYIAQVTALVVVALIVDGPVRGTAELVPWLAPTAIGTVLIEVWRRRLSVAEPSRG